jgi:hypothetical protein
MIARSRDAMCDATLRKTRGSWQAEGVKDKKGASATLCGKVSAEGHQALSLWDREAVRIMPADL